MMKKAVLSLVLCGSMLLCACSANTNTDGTDETKKTKETTEETTVATTAESTDETSVKDTTAETSKANTNVICVWRDEAIQQMGIQDYDWHPSEDGEAETQIMIYPEGEITDFHFSEIREFNVGDDGSYDLVSMEVFGEPVLHANRGLLINVHFMGDLPEYVYSYTDADGSVRTFMISISGEDGSIVTQEV